MKVVFFLVIVGVLIGGIFIFDGWLLSEPETHVIKVVVPGAPK